MSTSGAARSTRFRPSPALGRYLLIAGLALLIVYPLVMVVASVLFAEAWGARPLSLADLRADRVVRAWRNTLVLGGLVTLLSVLFGMAGALLAHRSRWARLVDAAMAVPFLTPPFLVSLAWSQIVGSRGYAARLGLDGLALQDALYSVGGMAVLMATSYAPLVYYAVRAQLARLPGGLVWAAAISGADRLTRLVRVVLPLLVPAVAAGGFLAFASAIGEYGTPLVIGQRIGDPGLAALLNSLGLALGAAAVGLVVGLLAARAGRVSLLLASIPVAVPAITTAVGFIRAWNAPWAASLPVYGTGTILLLYYLLQYLPFVAQYVAAGQAGMSTNLELAARVHGATRLRNLAHVALPLLWPHALAGAIMIFSISFRELVGSVLLRPPSLHTTSTFIIQQFDQGSMVAGTAMGVVAVLAALLSTVTAWLFAGKNAA